MEVLRDYSYGLRTVRYAAVYLRICQGQDPIFRGRANTVETLRPEPRCTHVATPPTKTRFLRFPTQSRPIRVFNIIHASVNSDPPQAASRLRTMPEIQDVIACDESTIQL
jgi:hypothetical protein